MPSSSPRAVCSDRIGPTCYFPPPMVYRRYRPRQPRANPVWQLFRAHWPALSSAPRWASYRATEASFLRCGDLQAGFVRFLCPDCDHEFLLAFTCKPPVPSPSGTLPSCNPGATMASDSTPASGVSPAHPLLPGQRLASESWHYFQGNLLKFTGL